MTDPVTSMSTTAPILPNGNWPFAPKSGGTKLTGIIRRVDGGPVEGAWVHILRRAEPPRQTARVAALRVDDEGTFETPLLEPDAYTVSAILSGFVAANAGDTSYVAVDLRSEAPAAVNLWLVNGGHSLRGVVQDPARTVVVGATVCAYATNTADGDGLLAFGVTDEAGRFDLCVKQDGRAELLATCSGFLEAEEVSAPVPGHRLALTLAQASRVHGRVVMATQQTPIEGVEVTLLPAQYMFMTLLTMGAALTGGHSRFSNADGTFCFDDVEPGRYSLCASSLDWVGHTQGSFVVSYSDDVGPVEVQVHPGHRIEGILSIVDSRETCESGYVTLIAQRPPWRWSGTVSNGRVVVGGLWPGEYWALFTCEGYYHRGSERILVTDSPNSETFNWRLHRGLRLTGRVVDDLHTPVFNARINLSLAGKQLETVITDNDGRFSFDGLAPGDYLVSAEADGLGTLEPIFVQLRPSRCSPDNVLFALQRTGAIEGVVLGRERRGLFGATIELEQPDETIDVPISTDRHGRFRIDGLLPGIYIVNVVSPTQGKLPQLPSTSDALPLVAATVVAGETATVNVVVDVPAPPFASREDVVRPDERIAGRVVDDEGQSLAGVFVVGMRTEDNNDLRDTITNMMRQIPTLLGLGVSTPTITVTDGDGRFQLESLSRGHYRIYAFQPDVVCSIVDDVTVGSTDVECVVGRPGSLSGVLLLPDGKRPCPSFLLSLNGGGWTNSHASYFCREDGSWRISDISPGKYFLEFQSEYGSRYMRTQVESNEETRHLKLVLAPPATICGRIIDFLTGNGIAGTEITVFGRDSACGFDKVTTDNSGRFELQTTARSAKMYIPSRHWEEPIAGYAGGWDGLDIDVVPGRVLQIPDVELFPFHRQNTHVEWGMEIYCSMSHISMRTDKNDGADDEPRCPCVSHVTPGSPADQLGLKEDDHIVEVNGIEVTNEHQVRIFGLLEASDRLHLKLLDGRQISLARPAKS